MSKKLTETAINPECIKAHNRENKALILTKTLYKRPYLEYYRIFIFITLFQEQNHFKNRHVQRSYLH